MSTSFSERSPLKFLSTPSARRATGGIVPGDITVKFLSTPSARRATRAGIASVGLRQFLSTPSARRATLMGRLVYEPELFLSTPSARRATLAFMHCAGWTPYFYPRPPRGGRPVQGEAA